jgi:hypothetical protein
MTQGSVTEQTDATAAKQVGAVPGLWPAAVMVLLSGLACLYGLMSANAADPAAAVDATGLAEVAEADLPGALTTMSDANGFLAQFKQRSKGCPLPLAWISIAVEPGHPNEAVRVRSGKYFSPLFTATSVPVRIAIPYPGPYPSGHGELAIYGAKAPLVVALSPAWHATATDGEMTHNVSWRPTPRCERANG